jgi:hypothetical protein
VHSRIKAFEVRLGMSLRSYASMLPFKDILCTAECFRWPGVTTTARKGRPLACRRGNHHVVDGRHRGRATTKFKDLCQF